MGARARQPNVMRAKGPLRPVPQYVAPGTWLYRGWEIDLFEVEDLGVDHWRFRARAKDRALLDRIHRQHKLTWMQREQIDLPFLAPSPDEHAALALAVYHIDKRETEDALFDRDKNALVDFQQAYEIVKNAIQWQFMLTSVFKRIPTRAEVTRQIETYRKSKEKVLASQAESFYRLPLAQRIELVDEMLAIDELHQAVVNPEAEVRIRTHILNRRTIYVEALRGRKTIGVLQAYQAKPSDMLPLCRRSLAELAEKQQRLLQPWIVADVRLATAERGEHIGVDLYIAAAQGVDGLGGAIVSMSCEKKMPSAGWTTPDAKRCWTSRSLARYADVVGSSRRHGYVAALKVGKDGPRKDVLSW